jgi:hypothetical protein
MELNGLANMKIRISRLADKGAIPAEDAVDLLRMADEFDKYLVAYHENPSIQWHEIKAKPWDFMTRGEQVEYFNKAWKMTDGELGQEMLDAIPGKLALSVAKINAVAFAKRLVAGKKMSDFAPPCSLEARLTSAYFCDLWKNAELPLKARMKATILKDEIERRCKA